MLLGEKYMLVQVMVYGAQCLPKTVHVCVRLCLYGGV